MWGHGLAYPAKIKILVLPKSSIMSIAKFQSQGERSMQQRLISFWGWLSRPNRIRFILLALTALALLVPEASALAENATGGSGG
jgi:hypothetical protein